MKRDNNKRNSSNENESKTVTEEGEQAVGGEDVDDMEISGGAAVTVGDEDGSDAEHQEVGRIECLGGRQVSTIAREARVTALQNVVSSLYTATDHPGQESMVGDEELKRNTSSIRSVGFSSTDFQSQNVFHEESMSTKDVEKKMRNESTDDMNNHNIDVRIHPHEKDTAENVRDVESSSVGVFSEDMIGISPPTFSSVARYQEPGAYRFSPAHPPRRVNHATISDDVTSSHDFSVNDSLYHSSHSLPLPENKRQETVLLEATLVLSSREDPALPDEVSPPPEPVHVFSSKLVEAKEITVEEENVIGIKKKHLFIGSVVCLLIAGCVGIIVGVGAGGANDGRDPKDLGIFSLGPTIAPTIEPTDTSTAAPTIELPLKDFRAALPDFSTAALADPSSPQRKALMWLAASPFLDEYTDQRQKQMFALATLYYETNGDKWTSNDDWLNYNVPECFWYTSELTTDTCGLDAETVEKLTLYVGMKGTIPFELVFLTQLDTLDFSSNDLTGTIPQFISNLTSLRILDLSENELSGTLPTGLDALSRLEWLALGNQGKTPEVQLPIYAFEQWNNLRNLDLSMFSLGGQLPTEIARLTALEQLSLFGTKLGGPLVTDLATLTNLKLLYLDTNDLTGTIPPSWSRLTSLEDLFLFGNRLKGPLTSEVGQMTSLENVYLSFNELSGSIPEAWGSLSNLKILDLAGNALEGPLIENVTGWTRLKELNLESNRFRGTIPRSWGDLSGLKSLDLSNNDLSGSVPAELCRLVDSNSIVVSVDCQKVYCECCGCVESRPSSTGVPQTIPPSPVPFVQLTTETPTLKPAVAPTLNVPVIEEFRTSLPQYMRASLTDPASPQSKALAWLANNTNVDQYNEIRLTQRYALATLYYATNGDHWSSNEGWLSDSDECTWSTDDPFNCNGQLMAYLVLYERSLLGTIPPEIGLLSLLVEIDLDTNRIQGSIPTTIALLQNLEGLWLFGNSLSGTLPTEISTMTQLSTLDLDTNSLSSSIPATYSQLTNLVELWLGTNQLVGTFPEWISGLTSLRDLYLSENNIQGRLPESLSRLSALRNMELQSMGLTGEFPDEIWGSFTDIEYFGIGDNLLQGTIGSGIGQLTRVGVFDVFRNSFGGPIPTEIGLMQNVTIIDLSENFLTNEIPSHLAFLPNLQTLHLYDNLLSGSVPIELCNRVRNDGLDLAVDCNLVSCDCSCNCILSST